MNGKNGKAMSEAEIATLKEDMQKEHPPRVAREFVTILNEMALYTLTDYLKAHGAPKEVTDLLDNLAILEDYDECAFLRGTVSWHMNSGVEATIVDTINQIAALGGKFHGPASIGQRETPVAWPGLAAQPAAAESLMVKLS